MLEHSLFLAIMPDRQIGAAAYKFAGRLYRSKGLTGELRPIQTLHISLFPIAFRMADGPRAELVAGARRIASQVKARPFVVSLNRAESWTQGQTKGPVVLVGEDGVIGVHHLHDAIARAHGLQPQSGFNPHMTLARSYSPFAPAYVGPFTWTVREFVLVHSLVGLGRYEILARFPLAYPGAHGYAGWDDRMRVG